LNDPELAHESCGVAFLNHLVLRNMLWHARVHLGMIWIDSAQIIPKWTFMRHPRAFAMGNCLTTIVFAGGVNYSTAKTPAVFSLKQ
jgi:hypothetical protein